MRSERAQGWVEVLKIAWPLIISNAFWNLQMTIDRVFLGQFSTDSLAATVSVAGVFWAPMALVQQTASYVTVFVAQYYGAKKGEMIGPSVWQSIYVSIVGGLLFFLAMPFAPAMFAAFGHAERLQVLEVQYFHSLCASALPTALVAAASGFFTGIGKSSMVIWINLVGLIGNAVFDYLLIFGYGGFPQFGVAGAGYATGIGNYVAAIAGFALIFTKQYETLYRTKSSWKFNGELLRRFLKYGVPSGLQWALEGLAFTVFLIYVGRMPAGDAALAASGITVTVMMLSVLPALGVAQAVSALVGQHLGENNPLKAEKSSWSGLQIAMGYMAMAGLSFVLFPDFYLSWFKNSQETEIWRETAKMVPYLLMFVAVFTLFDSANMVLSFALRGAGDTKFVSLVALTVPWPIMVLPTYLVSRRADGIYLAWGAAAVYVIFQAILFMTRFRQGKWKSMRVM